MVVKNKLRERETKLCRQVQWKEPLSVAIVCGGGDHDHDHADDGDDYDLWFEQQHQQRNNETCIFSDRPR